MQCVSEWMNEQAGAAGEDSSATEDVECCIFSMCVFSSATIWET